MNYHDDCLAVRPIVCPPCDQSRDLCEIDEEGEGARTINLSLIHISEPTRPY